MLLLRGRRIFGTVHELNELSSKQMLRDSFLWGLRVLRECFGDGAARQECEEIEQFLHF